MKNIIIFTLFAFFSVNAQQINYTKKLRFSSETGEKLSVNEVRKMMNNEILLEEFNKEISTRKVGNILIFSGPILILTDMFSTMYGPSYGFPSALSYVGILTPFIGILVKSGYQTRLKNIIDLHNKNQKDTVSLETNLILNGNGVGISISF